MSQHLPTLTSATWSVTSLIDSLRSHLNEDATGTHFYMFAYAVTQTGWQELRDSAKVWLAKTDSRKAVSYIGTDHALTDPDALRQMRADGIEVRMMLEYTGIFHPKVFWLYGPRRHTVWVGSNNITRDGLLQNMEFASLISASSENPELRRWSDEVHKSSEMVTDGHITSYEAERRLFADKRADTGTFTWTKRREPTPARSVRLLPPSSSPRAMRAKKGDLIVEVMPRETGLDGKQMQLPKAAAISFFGLDDSVGASCQITLKPIGITTGRSLTLSIFGNQTTRLSINELDYRDRPCVILFRRIARAEFQFEIVRQSIFPDRYKSLLSRCANRTRTGSRRWAIL